MKCETVKIIETTQFVETSDLYLCDTEKDAVRCLLANQPTSGSPVSSEFPTILGLPWRNGNILVLYTISSDLEKIYLLAVTKPNPGGDGPGTGLDTSKIQKLLKALMKIGIGISVKELLDDIIGLNRYVYLPDRRNDSTNNVVGENSLFEVLIMKEKDILISSLEEVIAIENGDMEAVRITTITPKVISVQELRTNLKLSQDEFARRYGLKVGTIRNWEQGIRSPDQSAQVLLRLIEREPEFIFKILQKDSTISK